MSLPAPVVVAVWGALNGALVGVLAGFGAKPYLLALYGSAAALVEIFALLVWRSQRRRPPGGRSRRHVPNGDSVLLFALGVLIAGLGIVFYQPLALLALVPFAFALMREISVRRGNA